MASIRTRLAANRDLVVVSALAVAALVSSVLGATGAAWLPVALPLLFVLPGYVTAAFAYATRGREPWTLPTVTKRLGFAMGGSLAVVPILAVLTYLSPLSLTPAALTGAVSGYVLLGVVATALRRARASAYAGGERTAPTSTWTSAVQLSRGASPVQLVLAVSVVVAIATLGVAVAVPSHGATTSDLHLLTEQDGRLVANEYPDSVPEGGSAPITVGVTNDEHQPVAYTVVAELQRVSVANRTAAVEERRELGRYAFELGHDATWQRQLDIQGALTGEEIRFAVYLYRGEAPQTPTAASAYRNTYIWLDVQPADGE